MISPNPQFIKIVLFEPRIPQNTGCIGRTSAALKIQLILIEPLGFSLEDKYLKRAGLDYWPLINIKVYPNFDSYKSNLESNERLICCSKSDGIDYKNFNYRSGDNLLFGREDIGLPSNIKDNSNGIVSIPMPGIANSDGTGGVRSLNLSVAVGIICYEAASQIKIL